MFVPFISEPSKARLRKLYRRKGGGGGGKGGGGSSSSSGSSGGGASGGKSSPISAGGSSKSATTSGAGGGTPAPIPAGQPFAGRVSGGGTRDQVYGNQYVLRYFTSQLSSTILQTVWKRLPRSRRSWGCKSWLSVRLLASRLGRCCRCRSWRVFT